MDWLRRGRDCRLSDPRIVGWLPGRCSVCRRESRFPSESRGRHGDANARAYCVRFVDVSLLVIRVLSDRSRFLRLSNSLPSTPKGYGSTLILQLQGRTAHRRQVSNSKTRPNLEQVGVPRFELGTSSLSGMRSNQLSYTPPGGGNDRRVLSVSIPHASSL